MDPNDFTSAATRILLPVLAPMGFRMQTHTSGRLYLADFESASHVVSVSFEPGDNYWLVMVFTVRDGDRSDWDDPIATQRLGELNARFLTREDGEALRKLRSNEAHEMDEASRRFRRIAAELSIVLPRYVSSPRQHLNPLGLHESVLSGTWLHTDDGPRSDRTCVRIDALTRSYLTELATDASGWSTLYRDPGDGRLWELTYLQSDLPGGGPPTLRVLTVEEAAARYGRASVATRRADG